MEVLNMWTLSVALALCCSAVTARPRHGVLLCVGQGENNVFQYDDSPSSVWDDGGGGSVRHLLQDADDRESTVVQKRSALGLFGLATKRPHKSAADLVHPPPLDAFMSVRGRKRSSNFYGKAYEGSPPGYVYSGYPPSPFSD